MKLSEILEQIHQVSSKSDEKQKSFINSRFCCSEFQSVSRMMKNVHSARGRTNPTQGIQIFLNKINAMLCIIS